MSACIFLTIAQGLTQMLTVREDQSSSNIVTKYHVPFYTGSASSCYSLFTVNKFLNSQKLAHTGLSRPFAAGFDSIKRQSPCQTETLI